MVIDDKWGWSEWLALVAILVSSIALLFSIVAFRRESRWDKRNRLTNLKIRHLEVTRKMRESVHRSNGVIAMAQKIDLKEEALDEFIRLTKEYASNLDKEKNPIIRSTVSNYTDEDLEEERINIEQIMTDQIELDRMLGTIEDLIQQRMDKNTYGLREWATSET